jgi:hypothetical protein
MLRLIELFLVLAGAGLVMGGVASVLPERAWTGKDLPIKYILLFMFLAGGFVSICSSLFNLK